MKRIYIYIRIHIRIRRGATNTFLTDVYMYLIYMFPYLIGYGCANECAKLF